MVGEHSIRAARPEAGAGCSGAEHRLRAVHGRTRVGDHSAHAAAGSDWGRARAPWAPHGDDPITAAFVRRPRGTGDRSAHHGAARGRPSHGARRGRTRRLGLGSGNKLPLHGNKNGATRTTVAPFCFAGAARENYSSIRKRWPAALPFTRKRTKYTPRESPRQLSVSAPLPASA